MELKTKLPMNYLLCLTDKYFSLVSSRDIRMQERSLENRRQEFFFIYPASAINWMNVLYPSNIHDRFYKPLHNLYNVTSQNGFFLFTIIIIKFPPIRSIVFGIIIEFENVGNQWKKNHMISAFKTRLHNFIRTLWGENVRTMTCTEFWFWFSHSL